jgi:hypothetical protein
MVATLFLIVEVGVYLNLVRTNVEQGRGRV